ncbi:MAG: PTS lactose transporter subunit IIB [Bacillota bacterium]
MAAVGVVNGAQVHKIIFACEAGMGSSALGVSQLRSKLNKAGLSHVEVTHLPVHRLPADAQVVVVHSGLAARARQAAPGAAVVAFKNFLMMPEVDDLIARIKAGQDIVG